MRSPLAYATLIALLAVVPVVVMEGRPGAFFEPLAIAYALAVGAAMLVALTLTPALSLILYSWGSVEGRESPLLTRLAPRYRAALGARGALTPGRDHRRGRRGPDRRACVRAPGQVRDPDVQGQGRARQARRRAGNVQPADDADHHGPEPRAAGHSGRRQRRRPRRARRHGRPACRRQLQRGLGQHRLRRRLRRDARIDQGHGQRDERSPA